MGLKKCNFSVKANPRKAKGTTSEQNAKLVKIFMKKFKNYLNNESKRFV